MTSITAQVNKHRKDRVLVRWAVGIGVSVSVTANAVGSETVLNAAFAIWPPLALLLTLELLPRIPIGRWYVSLLRILATLAVAGAAAWLSYTHMATTAAQHGEEGISSLIWPISVDGLMTVAAIALVEIGARIRDLESRITESTHAPVAATVTPAPVAVAATTPAITVTPNTAPPVDNRPIWAPERVPMHSVAITRQRPPVRELRTLRGAADAPAA